MMPGHAGLHAVVGSFRVRVVRGYDTWGPRRQAASFCCALPAAPPARTLGTPRLQPSWKHPSHPSQSPLSNSAASKRMVSDGSRRPTVMHMQVRWDQARAEEAAQHRRSAAQRQPKEAVRMSLCLL